MRISLTAEAVVNVISRQVFFVLQLCLNVLIAQRDVCGFPCHAIESRVDEVLQAFGQLSHAPILSVMRSSAFVFVFV